MQVENSVIVVTGAASGLGEGAARYLAKAGARVAGIDVQPISAESESLGISGYLCDVSDDDAVTATLAGIARQHGRIDAVVNCAGIVVPRPLFGPDGAYPPDLFRRIVDINLTGTFQMMTRAVEHMVTNDPNADDERGVFVNIASIAAIDRSSSIGYAASKGGVVALSLTAATDLVPYGIRTNAIAPGFMDTPMFAGLPQDYVDNLMTKVAFPKRLARMEEFGHLVRSLIENAYMNGALIRFDAGARS